MTETSIKEVCQYLESLAPLHFQESYDNAGLIVGNEKEKVKTAIVCLDSTEEVIDEAIALGANLVIAHHPIIFSGLKRITGQNYIERVIIKAIKNNIAIYAIHTNLDSILYHGVNEMIAQKLGIENLRILCPKKVENDHQFGGVGAGIIGELARPAEETFFLEKLKSKMACQVIRHTKLLGHPIQTVAICGGSGSFLLPDAIAQGAQIFISADFKYHQFFDANDQILIADIGHYESEQFTISLLHRLLTDKFTTFAAHCSKIKTNPVNYL